MKINTSDIYKRYSSKIELELSSLRQEKANLENSKEYVLKNLETYKDFIESFCTIRLDEIDKVTLSYFNRTILQKKYEDHYSKENLIELETKVKRLVNAFVAIKKRLSEIDYRTLELKNFSVDSSVFNNVIGSFNKNIIDEILRGYSFNFGYSISYIKILGVDVSKRKKKKVDWGNSNKNKKEIISRGGIPYEVLERDKEGKILLDNSGEHWMVYHNKSIEYLWHWAKGRAPFQNKYFYKFKPTYCGAANNGSVQKLRKIERETPENLRYFN